MSEQMNVRDFVKGLSEAVTTSNRSFLFANSNGDLEKASAKLAVAAVFTPITGDIDNPIQSGIYNISGSTGTFPGDYGRVLVMGTGDSYQLAITSAGVLFFRTRTNGIINPWKRVAFTVVGGG